MDVEEIEFTEWQIDEIRNALNYYRITKTSNGQQISWEQVRDEIIYSDVNREKYELDDKELEFKSESLRRFAAGTNVLKQTKLKDVTRFLIDDGLLKLSDLEEVDVYLKGMLAAHKYLAASSESSNDFIMNVEGTYSACLESIGGMWETFTLRIIADPSGRFVRVAEMYEVSAHNIFELNNLKARDAYTTIREHRTGYGFAVTEDNCLHVFLSENSPVPSAAYVQTGWLSSEYPILDICLLRHGLRHLPTRHYLAHPDGSTQLFNAFKFIPTGLPV